MYKISKCQIRAIRPGKHFLNFMLTKGQIYKKITYNEFVHKNAWKGVFIMDEKEIVVTEAQEESLADEHEGFTVGLALVDAIPVIFFSASLVLIASALAGSGATFWIVLVGAVMVAISGLCKVLWKLLLGLKVGDIKILNKIFVPFMAVGFMTTLVGVIVGTVTKVIKWNTVLGRALSIPSVIFFVCGFIAMGFMGKLKKSTDRESFNKDAKKNWIAQFVNGFAQAMIFLGIFTARG